MENATKESGQKEDENQVEHPELTTSGDFSALIKKLGMEKNQKNAEKITDMPDPENMSPLPEQSPVTVEDVEDFEDLLEDLPEAPLVPTPRESSQNEKKDTIPREPPARHSRKEKVQEFGHLVTPEKPNDPSADIQPEQITGIIEDETRDTAPPESFKNQNAAQEQQRHPEEELPQQKEAEEHIVSADQVSNLSGLILPKGATFRIEEFRHHGRVNAFENNEIGKIPSELEAVWKNEFSTVGFKDLNFEAANDDVTPMQKTEKKSGFAALFSAIRSETVEYNSKEHGPLVDLTFNPQPGVEEMEMYPVNEPYAYVRVIYDHATHEYTYQVIEPILTEPEKDLFKEIKERLFETLDINTKDITKEDARRQLRKAVDDILADYGIRLTPAQREKILYSMHKEFLGNGLIDAIMHDKYIEDISCDGIETPIFAFHSNYESMKTTVAYHTAEDLDSFVTKLAQRSGKYISIAEPILDATMQDGSRIQMTLGQEVTAHGSTFTIRKFKDEPITPTDLIEWHTFAPLSIAYIWLAVENGKSAIFAGGTASGKTTALNAISLFIPPMAKIVSLEDTREVKLPHPNWIPSVTRDSFDTAGRGEINMYELLRAAMRQRPEYIIVGEVRGKECQTLFQAMSTGHVTYSTTHADSVASVVHRIENPPMDVPRNMLSALDFICIQVQARSGGKRIRRNKQIVEILDIDPRTNELITNEVFKWKSSTDEIIYSGKSYLLEEIMEARGWSENRMREELKRRQEVLEWMRIKKIRHYKDVAKILISYFREPEVVIERVRKDLYE
ncbi:MAG: type II/IV secretion system ATPase subunit [Methanoregula sp.]|nr:type II/IV secretion system ATPase subunit [Methanoregula sp.]